MKKQPKFNRSMPGQVMKQFMRKETIFLFISLFIVKNVKEQIRESKFAKIDKFNYLKPLCVLFLTLVFKISSNSKIMVKYTIRENNGPESTRFSRELNTYGVGEELLYPVQMNDSSSGQQQPETNLATYLINFQEFQKSKVEIKKKGNKAW